MENDPRRPLELASTVGLSSSQAESRRRWYARASMPLVWLRRVAAPLACVALLALSALGCEPTAISGARVAKRAVVVPPLTAKDHRGRAFSLDQALARGPVALVFYRGFW